MEQLFHDLTWIKKAEPCNQASIASRILGDELMSESITSSLGKRVREQFPALCLGAIRLLQSEDSTLVHKDNYVLFLTSLRHFIPERRAINLMMLEHTSLFLKEFTAAFAVDPHGYTAPEIISMWSSIVNEEGAFVCREYMDDDFVSQVLPCVSFPGVGSIVASLLVANLVGHVDSYAVQLITCFNALEEALMAAFSGQIYQERQWGPGPVTKAISSISSNPQVQQRIIDRGLLPYILKVVCMKNKQWPNNNFPDEYFTTARVSACKILGNVASSHDVMAEMPSLLPAIVEQLDLPHPAQVRSAVLAVIFQLCVRRPPVLSSSSDVELEPDVPSLSFVDVVVLAPEGVSFSAPAIWNTAFTELTVNYTVKIIEKNFDAQNWGKVGDACKKAKYILVLSFNKLLSSPLCALFLQYLKECKMNVLLYNMPGSTIPLDIAQLFHPSEILDPDNFKSWTQEKFAI